MKCKTSGVSEHYRYVEKSWWLSLEKVPGQSGDHEELQSYVTEAGWRMVERLISAALREKLLCVNYGEHAGTVHLSPARPVPECGVLIAEDYDPALTVLETRFSSLRWQDDSGQREPEFIDGPSVVLAWFAGLDRNDGDAWLRLAGEVAGSVLNDALSRQYRHVLNQGIVTVCRREKIGSLWAWVQSRKTRHEIPLWLEQWSAVGHPLHLAPKNRSGLQPADILQCFPEFYPQVPVKLAAVVKTIIGCELYSGINGLDSFLAEEFPQWNKKWTSWLREQGKDPDDFSMLPLHPLQVSKYLPALQGSVFSEADVLLDGPEAPCHPTLSVRTVVPCTPDSAPHIKLALGVRLTSMRRNLSQRSCVMGPRISALLESVIRQDSSLERSLTVAPELAGVYVNGIDPTDGQPLRDLSAIFRRNPTQCIDPGETLVPASALPLISPVSDKPLFLELVERDLDLTPTQVLHEFRAYAQMLLYPVLRLFYRYGILMEAHPQNAFLVVNESHRPERILLRDLGGIRIHEPTLRDRGFHLAVHHDRLTVSDEWTTARRRLMHAVYQWHLGHLAWSVSRASGLKEVDIWEQIRGVTAEILDEHRSDMSETRWREESEFLMVSGWQAKSSIRMRLNDTSDELFVPAPNPMSVRTNPFSINGHQSPENQK